MPSPSPQAGAVHDGIESWIERIGRKPVPVLPQTVTALRSDVTSVQQALMMLGTEKVSELPAPALERLHKTFARAYHAARQATDWAILRRDMTPDEVFAATQLHFLGEMFVAIYAPQQLDAVDQMRREKHIACEEAEYLVLGFTLDQLTARLARLWRLPKLVLEALHPENARFPRAYGIMLAVQLARSAAIDWYGERTRSIESRAELITRAHRLAVSVAHDSTMYRAVPAASRLPMTARCIGQSPLPAGCR